MHISALVELSTADMAMSLKMSSKRAVMTKVGYHIEVLERPGCTLSCEKEER